MAWIKRNLYFVVGSAVALVLMVWAGFTLYSNWKKNETARQEIASRYAELKRLYAQSPHPGDAKTDNIKRANEERERVEKYIQSSLAHFQPIQPIPPGGRVTGEQFSAQLRRTVDQLQRAAATASVQLPPKYNFTFAAQVPLMVFAPGSLEPLAQHLGEIKAICEVLFAARVNALEGLRRERVSADDNQGFADYLEVKTRTNELALIVPYDVTFRCFSAELAAVLNGFADSSHGFFIRSVNVEPASDAGLTNVFDMYGLPTAGGVYPGQPAYTGRTYPPAAQPGYQQYQPGRRVSPEAEMEAGSRYGAGRTPYGANPYGGGGRYGANPYGGGANRYGANPYGVNPYGGATPAPTQPRYGPRATPGASGRAGGPETLINEGPIRVTMRVEVIRLLPSAENN